MPSSHNVKLSGEASFTGIRSLEYFNMFHSHEIRLYNVVILQIFSVFLN
jgi:hypothetical protein